MSRWRSATCGLLLSICTTLPAFAASVLIYGPSMRSDTPNEQTRAEAAGHTVTVVEDVAWALMTEPQFAAFDAIVFGDNGCDGDFATTFAGANDNKEVWSAAITGNKVLHTFDPFAHDSDVGGGVLVSNAITFAASGPGTGLYVSTGCYADGDGTEPITFLSEIGAFTVEDESGDVVTFEIPGSPVLTELNESDLEGWGSSYHALIQTFPSEFSVVATDGSSEAIIITAGATVGRDIPSLSPGAMALLAGMLAVAATLALRFR